MADVVIPKNQKRYLEPFKNRTYSYDNKHSNVFLSRYVNNILRTVGNDVIVRGLVVKPHINATSTGIDFVIEPGALIQDLTYIELPLESNISIDEITSFPSHKVIVYTSWRHLDIVYSNPLKIEVTLYDPVTENTLTRWNSATDRIILGIFNFELENGLIVNIREDESMHNIVLIDSNVIKNSTFDIKVTSPWIPINSELSINEIGGIQETPCCRVTPIGGSKQGLAQTVVVKKDVEYRFSMYMRGVSNVIPFVIQIIDGNNIYEEDPIVLATMNRQVGLEWTRYELFFTPLSTNASVLITKDTKTVKDNEFEVDNIYMVEYTVAKKSTTANNVKYVDGGIL